jgi:uncharacterized membrane protein YgcG
VPRPAGAGGQRLRWTRAALIVALRERLEDDGFPRLQMALIGALTGAAGLLGSTVLLHAGMTQMAWRYPLALALAYGFFLLLLWLWLRTRAEEWADAGELLADATPDAVGALGDLGAPVLRSGGGGDFGGGGASGSFEAPGGPLRAFEHAPAADDASPLPALGEAAGAAGDADELAVPLVIVVLIVGLALASFYVVAIAPTLMAELLLDGMLSYSLYRRLRGVERGHWFLTAVRRTALPFALTGVFLAGVGWAMAQHAPHARSIGEVLQPGPPR